jgi:formylglycine-generating enzyme
MRYPTKTNRDVTACKPASWMASLLWTAMCALLLLPVLGSVLPAAEAPARPAWASDYGKDKYGTWADLTVGGVVQRMRFIPPGTFKMGSPTNEADRSEDELQHAVTLTKGFWLGDSEVTQGLWQAVMDANPSRFKGDANNPVEQISWDDCETFFKKLNAAKPGLAATFPTEAQWEYACRAGTTGAFAGNLDAMAWYDPNKMKKTHAVKTKSPNAWGLYDMHGNVWEWCGDFFGEYKGAAERDPIGPDYGNSRIYRGGAWNEVSVSCRAAYRINDEPGFKRHNVGVRLAVPGK